MISKIVCYLENKDAVIDFALFFGHNYRIVDVEDFCCKCSNLCSAASSLRKTDHDV
jgi:hypothetical protein